MAVTNSEATPGSRWACMIATAAQDERWNSIPKRSHSSLRALCPPDVGAVNLWSCLTVISYKQNHGKRPNDCCSYGEPPSLSGDQQGDINPGGFLTPERGNKKRL
jgi:hypothetical protein